MQSYEQDDTDIVNGEYINPNDPNYFYGETCPKCKSTDLEGIKGKVEACSRCDYVKTEETVYEKLEGTADKTRKPYQAHPRLFAVQGLLAERDKWYSIPRGTFSKLDNAKARATVECTLHQHAFRVISILDGSELFRVDFKDGKMVEVQAR
jgi:hypothetical protein